MQELHPGIHYISSSADDVVSGHGPYQAMPLEVLLPQRATTKFHSEMGMPNIVTMDSLKQMMPEAAMWPQGAHVGPARFLPRPARRAAPPSATASTRATAARTTSPDWVSLAQFVNYEGYRAMFEAQSKNRMGLLDLDEPSHLAVLRVADLRLLLRAHRRLLRRQEGLRAAAHPVEPRRPTPSRW